MTEQELMLTHIRNCRRIDLYSDPRSLDAQEEVRLQDLQTKRQAGYPLQYLFGECEFMGFKFLVNPDVLIPRPETELLVELALEKLLSRIPEGRPLRILDLGTGSGNIAVSLAKLIDGVEVTAVDCSLPALDVAKKNARLNGVAEKINFIHNDIFSLPLVGRGNDDFVYDLIISNPPYIPSSQINRLPLDVQREPRLALDGGEDGLRFYRHIFAYAARHLNDDGLLMTEIGDGQRPALETILQQHPKFSFEFHQDYRETDRILVIMKR